jgi:hypothetical protein
LVGGAALKGVGEPIRDVHAPPILRHGHSPAQFIGGCQSLQNLQNTAVWVSGCS